MADNASEIVGRVLESFASSALQEINWISGVKDEVERIRRTLLAIDAVLVDAQEQQSTSNTIRNWLQNLKSVAYDIEDVLDLISTQELELKVNGRSLLRSITRLFTNYDVARELKAIRLRLDEIEYNRKSFNLRERQSSPLPVETTMQIETWSYIRESDVMGREEDKERMISYLVRFSSHEFEVMPVIPVIGIGGMGKTTLAKLLFNDPAVSARFELRLWVHVSSKFVLRNLIANVLQNATGLNFSHLNMELLQKNLHEILGGRTYLLILDDVWIKDSKDWIELRDLLAVGLPGSVIIVTTREEMTASITGTMEAYKLRGLSDEHCWSIFAKYAFNRGEEKDFPLLVGIGKSMVRKCCGVPLAAKTLGSVLRNERDECTWKLLEENELWKIKQGPNDIMAALRLSYDQTPVHLRSCFALCSVFEKGYPLFRIDLINMWMALGFLNTGGSDDLEAFGDRYFSELVSRSFLQPPGYSVTKKAVIQYARAYRENEAFLNLAYSFKSNMIQNMDTVSETLVHADEKLIFVEMHDLLHDLATFVSKEEADIAAVHRHGVPPDSRYFVWDHEELPLNSMKASKARVFTSVDPKGDQSKSFLDELLSKFRCLRILDLSHSEFEELPDTIGDLKHLRYLNLSWNSRLVSLPQSLCKLVNLQTLSLFRCLTLKTLPKDMHRLISLRFLWVTSKLKHFPDGGLCGLSSLRILNLWQCRHLESLSNGVESLRSLRDLIITSCDQITSLPNEMKHLTRLEELKICYCRNLDLGGWKGLHWLTSLKFLEFRELPRLSTFPDGLASVAGCLRYFRIANCQGLKKLPEGLGHCKAPLRLVLSDCPNLSALPGDIKAVKFLQELRVEGCPELKQKCEKDVGCEWHLISHVPKISIDHQVIQMKDPLAQQL